MFSPIALLNRRPPGSPDSFSWAARETPTLRSPGRIFYTKEGEARLYTSGVAEPIGEHDGEEYAIHAEDVQALRGEVVVLRAPEEADVEKAYRWDRDPELAAWNGRPPIKISLSAARRDYLARWEDPLVKTFIIEARANGESEEAVGLATLYDFRRDGCELGIKIGERDLRGRGYASEAVELLVSYCFEQLGLAVVRGSTLSHNVRMQRVFEKNGFREVGDGTIISRFDNERYTELFYERRRGG